MGNLLPTRLNHIFRLPELLFAVTVGMNAHPTAFLLFFRLPEMVTIKTLRFCGGLKTHSTMLSSVTVGKNAHPTAFLLLFRLPEIFIVVKLQNNKRRLCLRQYK